MDTGRLSRVAVGEGRCWKVGRCTTNPLACYYMEEDGFTLVKSKKKKRARKDKKGYFPSQCNGNFAIRIEEYVKDVAVTGNCR